MSELRESLNKLIREVLGDFPQGFNAGAVAGIPGWAGDMAYLVQEYPRALLTDTPLRPPVEYAGTTDSIAKAAGYEIPGTLSGQLGAAVGGLLSPGPGDLAKFAPLGAMFLGTKAATASQDALSLAKAMDAAGASRDEIWKATGELGQPWMKGPDGEWRFEIPDNEATVHNALTDGGVTAWRLEDGIGALDSGGLMQHEPLLAAYPTLSKTRSQGRIRSEMSDLMDAMSGRDQQHFGSYSPNDDILTLNAPIDQAKSTTLHELQHAVQNREDFARGGSPKAMGDEIDKLHELNQKFNRAFKQFLTSPDDVAKSNARQEMDYYLERIRKLQDLRGVFLPEAAYARLAGEAEARNVQSRMNMSLQDRINTPPWMTLDVPEDQLIVRRGLLNP